MPGSELPRQGAYFDAGSSFGQVLDYSSLGVQARRVPREIVNHFRTVQAIISPVTQTDKIQAPTETTSETTRKLLDLVFLPTLCISRYWVSDSIGSAQTR